MNIKLSRVNSVILTNNQNLFIDSIQTNTGKYSMFMNGKYKKMNELNNLQISEGIHLKDVCEVKWKNRKKDTAFRKNLQEGVSLYIFTNNNENMFGIANEIKNYLKNQDESYEILLDKSENIFSFYKKQIGILLLLFVARIVYISYKEIELLIIERELFCFISSSILSLYGIILVDKIIDISFFIGIGISIILNGSRNIFSRKNKIPEIQEQIHNYYKELAISVILFSAFYLAFIELIFLKCIISYILYSIGQIVFRLYHHCFIAKPIFPVFLNIFLIKNARSMVKNYINLFNLIASKLPMLSQLLRKVNQTFTNFIQFISKKIVLKYIIYLLIFISSIFIIYKIKFTSNFTSNSINILGVLEMPSGTSYGETNIVSQKIESEILKVPEIKEISVKVEKDHARYYLKLKEGMSSSKKLITNLKKSSQFEPTAYLFFKDSNVSDKSEIRFNVLGKEWNTLDTICKNILYKLKSSNEVEDSVLRYKSPRNELSLTMDKNKAFHSGITTGNAGDNLRMSIQGGISGKYFDGTRLVDIRLSGESMSYKNLDSMIITGAYANTRMKEIIDKKEGVEPDRIYRKNKQRTLGFLIEPRDESISQMTEIINSYPLPENYRIEKEIKEFNRFTLKEKFVLSIAFIFIGFTLFNRQLNIYIDLSFRYILLTSLLIFSFYIVNEEIDIGSLLIINTISIAVISKHQMRFR
jgi:multidrug efflux pump subunit AcrB